MTLTQEQQKICDLRLKEHQHHKYTINIALGSLTLQGFKVNHSVFRPETTSGYYLAQWLAKNSHLFKGKNVLDMCCGSGIQGIVMGALGAQKVYCSDISKEAVKNTHVNMCTFKVNGTATCGDLFENIHGRFDVMVCNHPFFENDPLPQEPITKAWFNNGELLQRFLKEAPAYLQENAKIIMPYFPFAGEKNNPAKYANRYGYSVKKVHDECIEDHNIQKGQFQIFQLERKDSKETR